MATQLAAKSGGRPFLTREQVIELRALRKTGITYRDLGILFNISNVAAFKICKGLSYKDIPFQNN